MREITQHAGARQILQPLSLAFEPGELIAIAGGSGAGKTTLLRTLAGLQQPSSGAVTHDGTSVNPADSEPLSVGYVPQDDIIHGELPLGRTLRHAARLRLPPTTSSEEIQAVVDETLMRLDLQDRASVPVKDLSGGQRKRASIAVELLTGPRLFVLDEPTSGLDPATSAEVVAMLRGLANAGTTVVMTTHTPEDLTACGRLIFLARDGHLAFDGKPEEALEYFQVDRLSQTYTRIDRGDSPQGWGARFRAWRRPRQENPPAVKERPAREPRSRPSVRGFLRQWLTLTQRESELLLHSRLTLAIILGSPVLVTMMMTVLFQPGAVDPAHPLQSVNIAFWLAFDGFFFGLTYGLLQIVMEFPIFARERRSGVSVTAYVASKIAILFPILLVIDVMILGVLRATDRLPADGLDVYVPLAAVFLLDALAGLAFGLLASALVRHPAQAALALPMICFPQVLFAGAIVPVKSMAMPGEWMSIGLATRWAFEAMSRILGVGEGLEQFTGSGTPDYSSAVVGSSATGAVAMLIMSLVLTVSTVLVLQWRSNAS